MAIRAPFGTSGHQFWQVVLYQICVVEITTNTVFVFSFVSFDNNNFSILF